MEGAASEVRTNKAYQETTLPPQYAHFNRLDIYTKNLRQLRDSSFFDEVYDATWVGLLMHIDRRNQTQHMTDLKGGIQSDPGIDHSGNIKTYWESLEQSSVFPIYERVRGQLRADHYAGKVVNSWNAEANTNLSTPNPKDFQATLLQRAAAFFPHVFSKPLEEQSFGSWRNKNTIPYVKKLHEEIMELGSEQLSGYLSALMLELSARNIAHDRLLGEINRFDQANRGEIKLTIPDMEAKIKRLLQDTEPYRYFANAMELSLRESEVKLFGEDAKIAGDLWRSVAYIRTSVLPNGVQAGEVRMPLIKLLVNKQYDQARYYVEELMAKYPGIEPKFVEEQLNIDPQTLRELTTEEIKLAQAKAANERQGAATPREQVLPYVGKTLVSPDGKLKIAITLRKGMEDVTRLHISVVGHTPLVERKGSYIKPDDLLAMMELYDLKPEPQTE